VLSLVVGTGLAWMNERTNTPFKTLFFALAIIPLVIPGILFTVAWIMLASPKIGVINLSCRSCSTPMPWCSTSTPWRDDLGRRAALFADGVPADDGGVPRHGSRRSRNRRR
jgi:ABC-type sugar transport system permease subunit